MADLSRRGLLKGAVGAAAVAVAPAVLSDKASAAVEMIDGVPHFDYRGERRQVVESAGAAVSDQAIAIIYYGRNPAVEDAARTAAAELIAQNWPVGIVLADGNETMQVYVNRQPAYDPEYRATTNARAIRDSVEGAHTRYLEAAQLAMSPQ